MKQNKTVQNLSLEYSVFQKYVDLERKLKSIQQRYETPLNTESVPNTTKYHLNLKKRALWIRDYKKVRTYIEILVASLEKLYGEKFLHHNQNDTPNTHINIKSTSATFFPKIGHNTIIEQSLFTKCQSLMNLMENLLEQLKTFQSKNTGMHPCNKEKRITLPEL